LWRYDGRRVVEIWKGAEAALFEPPAVSRDTKRVAIVLRQNGSQRLQLMAADGGDLQPIAATLEVRGAADWSPDGRWITIAGRDEKGEGLFKIAVDDGQTARLTSGAALNPVWSPDGGLIAYEGADVGAYATVAAVRPDGTRVDLPTIQIRRGGERLRFAPDGQSLVYMTGLQYTQNFWSLDLRTMKTRQLTALNNTATMRSFDITADGKEIVFDRLRENSDIVLIQLPNQVTR
jgi:Tol biopolymer transport system component